MNSLGCGGAFIMETRDDANLETDLCYLRLRDFVEDVSMDIG